MRVGPSRYVDDVEADISAWAADLAESHRKTAPVG